MSGAIVSCPGHAQELSRPQLHLPQHPKSHTHYRAHHQPPHTTVSLLGTVYYHCSWRCHRKTPALGKGNERWRGEGGSAAQG